MNNTYFSNTNKVRHIKVKILPWRFQGCSIFHAPVRELLDLPVRKVTYSPICPQFYGQYIHGDVAPGVNGKVHVLNSSTDEAVVREPSKTFHKQCCYTGHIIKLQGGYFEMSFLGTVHLHLHYSGRLPQALVCIYNIPAFSLFKETSWWSPP